LQDVHVRALTLENRGRTVIHTIELSGASASGPERPLQVLARCNRGIALVCSPYETNRLVSPFRRGS
jgi:hypothetical protein